VCNLYFETREIKLVECVGHKEYMEFPIPSEIQAFLEGKITESQLLKLQNKDEENPADSDEEDEEKENHEETKKISLKKANSRMLVNNEIGLDNVDNQSLHSEEEGKSVYDVEGETDVIEDLRLVDLRNYKYYVEK